MERLAMIKNEIYQKKEEKGGKKNIQNCRSVYNHIYLKWKKSLRCVIKKTRDTVKMLFCFFFLIFLSGPRSNFVEPLIAPVLDFMCPSSWVSNPEWISRLHSFLPVCCDPKGHVWCDTCLFHQSGCTLYKRVYSMAAGRVSYMPRL